METRYVGLHCVGLRCVKLRFVGLGFLDVFLDLIYGESQLRNKRRLKPPGRGVAPLCGPDALHSVILSGASPCAVRALFGDQPGLGSGGILAGCARA